VILAAALLVLLGLGLFVGGILTGTTLFYWLCVAACVAAGVFLVAARLRMGRGAAAPAGAARGGAQVPQQLSATTTGSTPAAGATALSAASTGVTTGGSPAVRHEAAPVEPAAAEPPSTAAHAPRGSSGVQDAAGDPPVEEVEVTDLLVVVDLRDEVLVVDEHPRYHLGGCRWLAGRETIPLPLDEARTDGFTPCAWCEPDRTLAQRERGRR
jgi:hypothetical protein